MNYLDASIVVSYYLPEARSARVNALFRSLPNIAISDFTEVEIASAVAIRVRKKLTSRRDGRLALNAFEGHLRAGLYHRVHVSPQHHARAAALVGSFDYNVRGPDAIHITIALLDGYHLYTADGNMASCAKVLGLATTRLA